MLSQIKEFTGSQKVFLVGLRFCIGWHLFYQGLGKFRSVEWSSKGYLEAAEAPLAGIFQMIAESPVLLSIANNSTKWGLVLFGLCLMLGLFTRLSSFGGVALLMLFYLVSPPIAAGGFTVPSAEGSELYVNKTLIEALALLLTMTFPTGRIAGLDILVAYLRQND